MSIKAVLFDLDGTLLPMDQKDFMDYYFKALATKLVPHGYETKKLVDSVWAGLSSEDFECYTTYENSHYCKPNPKYYEEVVTGMELQPNECLMVGNDVTEDMIAETIGMKVFLLTDCLINKENKDISNYPNGSFRELMDYIKSLSSSTT